MFHCSWEKSLAITPKMGLSYRMLCRNHLLLIAALVVGCIRVAAAEHITHAASNDATPLLPILTDPSFSVEIPQKQYRVGDDVLVILHWKYQGHHTIAAGAPHNQCNVWGAFDSGVRLNKDGKATPLNVAFGGYAVFASSACAGFGAPMNASSRVQPALLNESYIIDVPGSYRFKAYSIINSSDGFRRLGIVESAPFELKLVPADSAALGGEIEELGSKALEPGQLERLGRTQDYRAVPLLLDSILKPTGWYPNAYTAIGSFCDRQRLVKLLLEGIDKRAPLKSSSIEQAAKALAVAETAGCRPDDSSRWRYPGGKSYGAEWAADEERWNQAVERWRTNLQRRKYPPRGG